jgi:hypothetical protein
MSFPPLPRTAGSPAGGGPSPARRSHAFEQMSDYLGGFRGGQVVDLGGAQQSTIEFVTGCGHRLYAENLLLTLGPLLEKAAPGGFAADRADDDAPAALPADCLAFPPSSVDAMLCWDRLQFLPEKLASALVDRIHRIMAPGGFLLAMFHPEQAPAAAPLCCRVADARHLHIAAAGAARPLRPFNTRSIERFFHKFESLKFYLTRENLQEVIVRR